MSRLLYSIVLYVLTPLIFLYFVFRSRREPGYRSRLSERLAWFAPLSGARPIWVHAVSVGETGAAIPLIKELQARYPDCPVLVTTATPTGAERVQTAFGDSVRHIYAPVDLPGVARRFCDRVRPRLALVMETELWPNLYHALDRRRIPLVLVNARMSTGSQANYRRLSGLARATIACIDVIATQSPADADRYASLGAEPTQLVTTGNVKFDLHVPNELVEAGKALRGELGRERPVWIAASTHEDEEAQVLNAHRLLLDRWPDLLLILTPRHPDRFKRVAALCSEQGFRVAIRSRAESAATAQVYLADTMGELMMLYAAADAAFVGGSLVPTGGHNLLQPAALGLVPVSGPELFNFLQIAELLRNEDALLIAHDPTELAARIGKLLDDPAARRAAGERARNVVEANRGALERTLGLIARHMNESVAALILLFIAFD